MRVSIQPTAADTAAAWRAAWPQSPLELVRKHLHRLSRRDCMISALSQVERCCCTGTEVMRPSGSCAFLLRLLLPRWRTGNVERTYELC